MANAIEAWTVSVVYPVGEDFLLDAFGVVAEPWRKGEEERPLNVLVEGTQSRRFATGRVLAGADRDGYVPRNTWTRATPTELAPALEAAAAWLVSLGVDADQARDLILRAYRDSETADRNHQRLYPATASRCGSAEETFEVV